MIECRKINKIYKTGDVETVALKKVSLKISQGEFVAIIGPSGSGKSTLMHILGCLDTPTNGEYFFEERNISKLPDDKLAEIRKEKIGFVFQMFNLLPRATVLRNVILPLIYAGVPKQEREKKAIKALNDSAFPEGFWNHLSNQLSGGMMQRVALARALVNDPKIIFADEPTGNLDSKSGEVVLETFERLHQKQGRTIILVTHEKYIAEKARRIISVKDGEIIEDIANHRSKTVQEIKE